MPGIYWGSRVRFRGFGPRSACATTSTFSTPFLGKKRLNKHIFHAISRHIFFIYFSQKPARLPPSLVPPEVCRSAWSAWSAWWQKEAKQAHFPRHFLDTHSLSISLKNLPGSPPITCSPERYAGLRGLHALSGNIHSGPA